MILQRFLLVNPNVTELEKALEEALSWGLQERINRGIQARKFVEKNFSFEVVKNMWFNLYEMLIKEGG